MRPFFAATYVHVFVVWSFTRLITRLERVFLPRFWWGALSSNIFIICAVYWSLGRRGYSGVSNVVLVLLLPSGHKTIFGTFTQAYFYLFLTWNCIASAVEWNAIFMLHSVMYPEISLAITIKFVAPLGYMAMFHLLCLSEPKALYCRYIHFHF